MTYLSDQRELLEIEEAYREAQREYDALYLPFIQAQAKLDGLRAKLYSKSLRSPTTLLPAEMANGRMTRRTERTLIRIDPEGNRVDG